MIWVLFALLSAFFFSLVNVTDKYMLSRWVEKPSILLFFFGGVSLISAAVIISTRGLPLFSVPQTLILLSIGFAHFFASVLYYHALKRGEATRIVPLYQLAPLFVMVFAAVFLGEVFTPIRYAGIMSLIIGAFLISAEKLDKITLSKAAFLAILSCMGYAAAHTMIKYVLSFADFWTAFAYARMGAVLALLFTAPLYFNDLITTVKASGKKAILLPLWNESIAVLAYVFFFMAAIAGPITLVDALASFQSLFVFLIALLLGIFFPAIMKEGMSRGVILQKTVAIVLLIGGALMVTV